VRKDGLKEIARALPEHHAPLNVTPVGFVRLITVMAVTCASWVAMHVANMVLVFNHTKETISLNAIVRKDGLEMIHPRVDGHAQ